MARLEMHPRISAQPARPPRGFTLLEALVAVVILTIVASGAAVGIGLGSAAQTDARIAQCAMQAADQQMGFLLEQPFDSMTTYAVEESVGAILAPPAGGGVSRDTTLGGPWSMLGRRTSVTSEPLTFSQYNSVTVDGARIEIEVFGPDGTVYATLRRHRCRESES
jgi:prepilin-type N-terminal cleavage/methylation domain-containing protein